MPTTLKSKSKPKNGSRAAKSTVSEPRNSEGDIPASLDLGSNPSNNINLVVATPCFGGQISVLYAASLFKLQKLVRSYNGINLKILFKDGDALITRARASLISQFLEDPSATHLLFIDADIGFEPEQVSAPNRVRCGNVCGNLPY